MGLFKPNVEILAEKRDVKGLIKALLYHKKDYFVVRREAAEALSKIGLPAVEPLIAALKDNDWDVRKVAAEALGEIGDSLAVESLIAALKDKDRDVHYNAAVALGKIRDIRAVEPLIAALKDKN
ncbi:MAG: HEAT repeat domain-containing protein, partial [Candidatus Hydromicrobium sp.]|nr:HEAT repeat domain-containing protein [Candidatus Hydromicrobium sp.]